MTITQFIKIIQRNLVLLISIPIILATMVWYFTRDEKKIYNSSTTLYAGIASGSSIVSQEEKNVDFFGVKIVFDNFINVIKSRETMEETAIQLLIQNLSMEKPNPQFISKENWNELQRRTPAEIKKLLAKGDIETSKANFIKYLSSSDTNFLYKLISLEDPHYSVKAISSIKVMRIDNSDMVTIQYNNNDPGITQQTLVILTEVFARRYKSINENQSSNVVKYFEEQVALAATRLKEAEDRLLNFNQENNIINYYEQSKYIAAQKEELGVKIQETRMDNVAAQAAVDELESKLNKKEMVKLNSANIVELRNKLSDLTAQESLISTTNKNGDNDAKLVAIKKKIKSLKDNLQTEIKALQLQSETREGVPLSQILNNWLSNIIKFEETQAKLSILNERQLEFDRTYKKFAPLGATMKRIEREIEVAEEAYLSLLYSLSLAKLKQQNIEMSGGSKVVDAPYFPISPQASKRKVMILAAGMVGFIFTLALILILEYLDTTIKNLERAEKLIGLQVAGLYPKIIKYKKSINIDFVKARMIEVIKRSIKYKIEGLAKKTKSIIIFSTSVGEGKSTISNLVAENFASAGLKVLRLNYLKQNHDEEKFDGGNYDFVNYSIKNNFSEAAQISDLVDDYKPDYYDIILIEIPSIIYFQYPVNLVKNSDMSLMITRANRVWNKADNRALNIFNEGNTIQSMMVLNGVELDSIDSLLGEIPMKRSRLRRIIKKVLNFQVKSKSAFK